MAPRKTTAKKKAGSKVKAKAKKTVKKAVKKVAKKATKKTVKKVVKKAVKKAAAPKMNKKFDKALTRSQQYATISEVTGVAKKDVQTVLECLEPMIAAHLKGVGEVSLAGLMKVKVVRKPATKARKGVNPFTGEPTIFKAKPARNVIKIRPLKKLKDTV